MMVDSDEEMAVSILNQYHPLVVHIAKSACYSSSTLDINDLYQVGDMAVLRAVKAYDPSSGKNIKSFVANSIRNAIFNEAARFLGVMTVDFRTTAQASQAHKLHEKGKTDLEIADIFNEKYDRVFDEDHIRDLRITYGRRQYTQVQDDFVVDDLEDDVNIRDLLSNVIIDSVDADILKYRILGSLSVEELSNKISLSKKSIYEREAALKARIKRAIEDAA